MGGSDGTLQPDLLIAELAGRQHGVVTTAQLRELGLGTGAIEHRLRCGRLTRVHRGVYRIGGPTTRGKWLAAVLASGEGAVLSHASAGALWRIRPTVAGETCVTVPSLRGSRGRPGIVVHRSGALSPDEVTRRYEIPVTTAARTLIDLAPGLPIRALERAIDEADRLRLCDGEALGSLARARPHRPGNAAVLSVLARHRVGSTLTRLELEERFLALCRDNGLPQPQVNARVDRYTVDFLWPAERLIVETDGWESHRTRAAYERDRERDAWLAVLGYLVVRFTYRQVAAEPKVVASRVRSLLRLR